jgi:hypothetical protein
MIEFATEDEIRELARINRLRARSADDRESLKRIQDSLGRLARRPMERRAGRLHRLQVLGDPDGLPAHDVIAHAKRATPQGTMYTLSCGRQPGCYVPIGIAISIYFNAEHGYPPIARVFVPHTTASDMEHEAYGQRRNGDWRLAAPAKFGGDQGAGFDRVADGTFKVLAPRQVEGSFGHRQTKLIGRRPTRNVIHSGGETKGTFDMTKGLWGLVGWYPCPPAVIVCSKCGTHNLVEEPPPPDEDVVRRGNWWQDEGQLPL